SRHPAPKAGALPDCAIPRFPPQRYCQLAHAVEEVRILKPLLCFVKLIVWFFINKTKLLK
ncbi:MAG: hypothetical protein ACKVJI_11780, partial [Pseudomonadales bacterium]